ncbi:unnamed protein product, partial [Closterium sp. NIES-53]
EHLLAAETSAVAVGAARGTPRTPFFEGCSPSPLAPSYASSAAPDVPGAEDVGAASACAKRRSSKGKGSRGVEGAAEVVVGAPVEVVEAVEVVAVVGLVAGVGALVAVVEAAVGVAAVAAVGLVAVGLELSVEVPEVANGSSSSVEARPSRPSSFVSGCFSVGRLGVVIAARMSFERVTVLVRRAGSFTLYTAASPGSTMLGVLSLVTRSSTLTGRICLGIADAALGASESGTLLGTAPSQALHTFTLDSGASRCFFRDSTTLTPLPASVPVRLADPSRGSVVARSSTVLPCPAVPSGSQSGLHLPLFSTNLVSTAALQDAMVTTTTPGGQRVSICTCTRTGCHLARFACRPGSSLYTLATEPPQALLWHHRLGHPSLPRLRSMHSCLLVSGLPRTLPPLLPSPAPPCLPCVDGLQRATPHSSLFPTTTAPLQTLHMDVWGPARVSEQGCERYFLLVVDNYTRYTTVFPLRSKSQVVDVLIPWIRAVRLQLRERFRADLPVLRLHSDRGVLEVARTSMIHVAAPHFLWPFAVRYAAHQLNLLPHVSFPETSPTLRWTGKVGDLSVYRVWGSCAFVRDMSADKLSAHAIPSVFLGFVPNAPGWQFYHPTSRRVLPSQDVMFDELVPFYRLFPLRSTPLHPPLLFLAPGSPPVDPLPPQGPAPSGVSQVDPPHGAVPEVAVDSGAARGIASGGAEPGGAEPGGVEPGGAATGGAELGGTETGGAETTGSEPEGVEPG